MSSQVEIIDNINKDKTLLDEEKIFLLSLFDDVPNSENNESIQNIETFNSGSEGDVLNNMIKEIFKEKDDSSHYTFEIKSNDVVIPDSLSPSHFIDVRQGKVARPHPDNLSEKRVKKIKTIEVCVNE